MMRTFMPSQGLAKALDRQGWLAHCEAVTI